MCIDIDCFLKNTNNIDQNTYYILLIPKKNYGDKAFFISNRHLIEYWSQYLNVVKLNFFFFLIFYKLAYTKSLGIDLTKYSSNPYSNSISYKLNSKTSSKINLNLRKEDIDYGYKFLDKFGLKPSDWFVCFHARDSGWDKKRGHSNFSTQKYRNSRIHDYYMAYRNVVKRGGWVIRVGDSSMKKISFGDKFIDLTGHSCDDRLNIFLSAKCKLFVGCASGAYCISIIFGVPVLTVNLLPYSYVYPHGNNNFSLPKLLYSKKNKKYLKLDDIYKKNYANFFNDSEYIENEIEIFNNSPEDINDALNDFFKYFDDKKINYTLQNKFRKFLNSKHYSYGSNSFISPSFLKKYKDILF